VNRATRRRVLSSRLAVAGAAGLLAACGQRAAPPESRPAAAAEPVRIDFYHRWQAEREPLMVAQVEDFHALQPRVRVNNTLLWPWSMEKLVSMVVAGTPPDVIMIDVIATAEWAAKGMLHGVDDLLKRDRMNPKDIFYPASVALMQSGGKTVGMAQTVVGASAVLWVNLDLWQGAGLDKAKLPRTWDDLTAAAPRLTKRGAGGFEQIAGVFPGAIKTWATANGVGWVSPDLKQVLFNTAETAATLEFMLDGTNRLYGSQAAMEEWVKTLPGPVGAGFGYAGLVTNKIAMQIEGAWQPYRFGLDAPTFSYAAAMLPYNAKNPRARSTNLADNGFNYGLVSGSKKVDASWEWTKYITAGDGNPKFFRAQGRPSVVRKHNEAPDLKKLPYWEVVVKTMEQATAVPMSPAWGKIGAHVDKMAADVLGGKLAPRAAVEQYARLAQEELDQVAR
jgi:ABC-type glycerol-3-phosphate transport system substrate-binding protein